MADASPGTGHRTGINLQSRVDTEPLPDEEVYTFAMKILALPNVQDAKHLMELGIERGGQSSGVATLARDTFNSMVEYSTNRVLYFCHLEKLIKTLPAKKNEFLISPASRSIYKSLHFVCDFNQEKDRCFQGTIDLATSLYDGSVSLTAKLRAFRDTILDCHISRRLESEMSEMVGQHSMQHELLTHAMKYPDGVVRNYSYPGEEYGLDLFDQVQLVDGKLYVRDSPEDEWSRAGIDHPARKVPGSPYGKYMYDLSRSLFLDEKASRTFEFTIPGFVADYVEKFHLIWQLRTDELGMGILPNVLSDDDLIDGTVLSDLTGEPYPVTPDSYISQWENIFLGGPVGLVSPIWNSESLDGIPAAQRLARLSAKVHQVSMDIEEQRLPTVVRSVDTECEILEDDFDFA